MPCLRGHNIVALIIDIDRRPWMYLKLISLLKLQSVQRGVIHRLEALMVLRHWNEPEHAEFRDRNGYSLFNAYTSHWRDSDQFVLPAKTMRLKSIMAEFKQANRVDTVSMSSRSVL
jgi:hypothetical protein